MVIEVPRIERLDNHQIQLVERTQQCCARSSERPILDVPEFGQQPHDSRETIAETATTLGYPSLNTPQLALGLAGVCVLPRARWRVLVAVVLLLGLLALLLRTSPPAHAAQLANNVVLVRAAGRVERFG